MEGTRQAERRAQRKIAREVREKENAKKKMRDEIRRHHHCSGPRYRVQGSYNGRILGKKSENQTFAPFWSEFGGIFKSLEKFGGI